MMLMKFLIIEVWCK